MPYKYDPEVEPGMKMYQAMKASAPTVAVHDVERRRAGFAGFSAILNAAPFPEGVSKTVYKTTTSDGYTLEMIWYGKAATVTPGPAALHVHGGGMILGSVSDFNVNIASRVAASGVPLLSVEYRLAPEHPHPTLVEDCYTGLKWLRDHAKELNVDPTRIAVMGESAGGGIAAGVALLARDRKFSPPLAKQILVYPMLDDRTLTADKDMADFLFWAAEDNLTGWSALLGKGVPGSADVPIYASPARTKDLAGLPPTYIDVGELDLFREEDLLYARRLEAAQVKTELHIYPGCPHAFEGLAPNAAITKEATANRLKALQSF